MKMASNKFKFLGALSALLAVGFLATSLISYQVARDSLSDQIAENALPLTSDTIYSEIQQDLLRPIFISSVMAQDTFMRDWVIAGENDPAQIEKYLRSIQDRYGTFTAFLISERTHRYYHPSGKERVVHAGDPADAWYFHARTLTQPYEVNVDADKMSADTLTVFINHRVTDYSGAFIGITGVGLSLKSVKGLIETYRQRYGRRIYFIDRQGRVALHGNDYAGPASLREAPGLAPYATQILTSPSTSVQYEGSHGRVYLNSRLIDEFGWYLVVEQDENIADSPIMHTLLGNLAGAIAVSAVVLLLAHFTLGGYQRRLEEMATVDRLTRAVNRHAFDLLFTQISGAVRRRPGDSLSVVMMDIDHFKTVNDTHGHPAGDQVLRAIADTIRAHIRASDVLCRWGGEEFLLLLPDCDLTTALALAEKIRVAVGMRQIHIGADSVSVTLSAGVSVFSPTDDADSLIRRADAALYEAKDKGRNRVESVL